MHFDFSAVPKKNKSHSKPVKINIYQTIKKNVYCVAGIDLNGNYYAIDIQTNEKYIISSKSYSIKTRIYYSQHLIDGKRLQVIELKQQDLSNRPTFYLPFAPGVGLLGNLVQSKVSNNSIMFDLIRTFDMPKDNELACKEFLYFRNNYEKIRENIMNKYASSSI